MSQSLDLDRLAVRLTAILREWMPDTGGLTIVERRAAPYASSAPSEIVTCRLDSGQQLTLYCKYAARHGHEDYGHRGGRAYEAAVYRDLLRELPLYSAAFYGADRDEATGDTLLVLEYLEQSTRVSKRPETMGIAARWIGAFHGAAETDTCGSRLPWLHAYTPDYYAGWVRRTLVLASALQPRLPWLEAACARAECALSSLLDGPQTIVHGEYYPHNILVRDGTVYPIDWESAAIGAGVIDLASLTEQWPADVVQTCEREYQRARWPGGTPADFQQSLAAARMYHHFRWLGDRIEWTAHERNRWRFNELHSMAEGSWPMESRSA
jgi:aminoglycoside phosphotransferase (APT) family kinase protein